MGITRNDLMKAGFEDKVSPPIPRLIVSVDAEEKHGKTHFGLTAPPPVAYFDIDEGMDEIRNKFPHLKDGKDLIYYPVEYDNTDDVLAEKQVKKMIAAYKMCLEAPDSVVRSIVFDTDTEFWEMLRLARFGRLTQVKPHHYGPVNAEYRTLIRLAKRSSKNLILLHKKKDEYVKGKKSDLGIPTGKKIRAGMKEVGYLVQVIVELFRDEDGYNMEIKRCRQNPELDGEVFTTEYGAGDVQFPLPWGTGI
jgi:hypothetical protein